MSDEWPAEAVDYVQAVADTKLMLSHWYAECAFLGPNIADNIALLSQVQDEYGHARQLFFLLEAQGRDPDWLRGERDSREFRNAATLDEPADDWLELLVRSSLTDRAALLMLDAIVHEDFDGLVEKISEEEYSHLEFQDAWFRTLAESEPGAVEVALSEALPDVLAFLGPAEYDDESDPVVQTGFTDRSPRALREALVEHVDDLLAGTDVEVPDLDGPSLDVWDSERRRTVDGGPEARVIDAIRGVENREFAVK